MAWSTPWSRSTVRVGCWSAPAAVRAPPKHGTRAQVRNRLPHLSSHRTLGRRHHADQRLPAEAASRAGRVDSPDRSARRLGSRSEPRERDRPGPRHGGAPRQLRGVHRNALPVAATCPARAATASAGGPPEPAAERDAPAETIPSAPRSSQASPRRRSLPSLPSPGAQ